jgi:hypothetical protein
MDDTQSEFFEDMLRDSLSLEQQNEPGQAFDKLARAIESRLHTSERELQKDRAISYFEDCLAADEAVWRSMQRASSGIKTFGEDLSSHVCRDLPDDAEKLEKYGSGVARAVAVGDRRKAALRLAELFLLLRNKRFHGYPPFSGRNFRECMSARHLLNALRACLQKRSPP